VIAAHRVFFSSPETSMIISPTPSRAISAAANRSETLDARRKYMMAITRNTAPTTNITGELMGGCS
jgi:hypothetical protein